MLLLFVGRGRRFDEKYTGQLLLPLAASFERLPTNTWGLNQACTPEVLVISYLLASLLLCDSCLPD